MNARVSPTDFHWYRLERDGHVVGFMRINRETSLTEYISLDDEKSYFVTEPIVFDNKIRLSLPPTGIEFRSKTYMETH
jgi:hypothetical protein